MAVAATKAADFDQLAQTGDYVDQQWDHLIKILQDLWALHQGHEQAGTPGDGTGHVTYWYVASSASLRKWLRVGYDGTSFRVDKNTGTDAAPIWVNLFSINATTLAATLPAGLTLGGALAGLTGLTLAGDLDLGANDILNVAAITATTVNGVDPAAHATRHAVGGADALAVGTPVAVGGSNSAGAATDFARRDHVHEGVHEIDVNTSGSPVTGDADLLDGEGISITKVGGNITVALAFERVRVQRTGGDDSVSASTETIVQDNGGNLLQAQLSSADASKDYEANCVFSINNSSGSTATINVRVRVGSLGTLSDPIVFREDLSLATGRSRNVVIPPIQITDPAAGDWVTVSIESTQALTVYASSNRNPELIVRAVAA